MRHNATDAEQRLWFGLRDRQLGGFKFRRQLTIGEAVVDFCCWEERLVVEVDGGQHAEPHLRDERRTAALVEQGYRVLRFWNHEVLTETEQVLEVILRALEKGGPSP